MNGKQTIGVVIPTFNAGGRLRLLLDSLSAMRDTYDKCLIIDSGSADGTVEIAAGYDCEIIAIKPSEFNHGATRNLGLEHVACDIVVFFTQDAVPEKNAVANLLQAFDNPRTAVACGRQLPHDDANPLAAHARLFNYPAESRVYGLEDRQAHGLKTAFASNSFAAFRTEAFRVLGGFPEKAVFGEDMYIAAKALLAGYSVAYEATAAVKHSHNYSLAAQFRRSFDTGRFHRDEKWITASFGQPEAEGFRFVVSEWRYLVRQKQFGWLPCSFFHNIAKYAGYRIGRSGIQVINS